MKYVYYIMAILIIASALIIYQFVSDNALGEKKAAIVINDRIITVEEFQKLRPPNSGFPNRESTEDFINALITKELLIQEAQRQGVDKEEAFRRSIQDFYEQSLIKVLMDKKFAPQNLTVSDDEVDKYSLLLNKKLTLTLQSSDSLKNAQAGKYDEAKMIVLFGDLSRRMQSAVTSLKKGEKTPPTLLDDKYVVIRLDDIQSTDSKPTDVKREEIRRMLLEGKQEDAMGDWIDGLRKKARIDIRVNGGKGG